MYALDMNMQIYASSFKNNAAGEVSSSDMFQQPSLKCSLQFLLAGDIRLQQRCGYLCSYGSSCSSDSDCNSGEYCHTCGTVSQFFQT
jgi:hypothetical protein